MTVYHLDEIAGDVRIALDQNTTSDVLKEIGDVDTLALNDIIKSKIIEAVKRVHSSAPPYLLDEGHNFGDEVYWQKCESGWVLLPEDFMRFVVFQMSDWERAVFYPINVDDPEYEKQSSRFKGIRGTTQRPVCAISIRPEGRVLEFYSCKSQDATVSRAVYLPYPKIDKYGAIEICQRCYDAVVYTIAALVLTTFGDVEKSSALNELAKSVLI
ncbi:hypothetical protein ACNONS_20250 [Bacteroides xylanisolvens]|uniref:hypothetical protein n=1 Tax=Bacteroides TaxID=816 RepID=UPI003AABB3E1